jgi:hypothetical protein
MPSISTNGIVFIQRVLGARTRSCADGPIIRRRVHCRIASSVQASEKIAAAESSVATPPAQFSPTFPIH